MLSISFLPWVLLLLALIVSIPAVSFIETRRRKKAVAEYEAQLAQERATVEESESEEIVGEGMEDPAGIGDFGDTGFGTENPAMAEFDDDTFK